jgi:hypothetical protein
MDCQRDYAKARYLASKNSALVSVNQVPDSAPHNQAPDFHFSKNPKNYFTTHLLFFGFIAPFSLNLAKF